MGLINTTLHPNSVSSVFTGPSQSLPAGDKPQKRLKITSDNPSQKNLHVYLEATFFFTDDNKGNKAVAQLGETPLLAKKMPVFFSILKLSVQTNLQHSWLQMALTF